MGSGFALVEEGKYLVFLFFLITYSPKFVVRILAMVELDLTEDSVSMISRTLGKLLKLTNERRRTKF